MIKKMSHLRFSEYENNTKKKTCTFVMLVVSLVLIPQFSLATYSPSGEYVHDEASASEQQQQQQEEAAASKQAEDLLREIVKFGIDESEYLTNVKERHLYDEGVKLKKSQPAHFVAVFNKQKKKSKEISKFAYASLHASSLLARQ